MKKTKITKTLGPIHFEDLEPHRFEDLIGDLIYDFREWRNIESTGRGGSDDGFDIRAWEKNKDFTNNNEDEEGDEGVHPMDGNLWMVQCKREKSLGPRRVKEIINENIKTSDIPYGYILVAPVNFSKKSYDVFREELRKRGVMEFYLWGSGDLERLLYMPKYDHILFAFFGVSLITKKRSRSSELKFVINNKNKLLRILTNGEQTQKAQAPVLIRDINDESYPRKRAYRDFDENPRWQEHIAFGYTTNGLLIHKREYYAYIDFEKKQYDFTDAIDLVMRENETKSLERDDKKEKDKRELISKVEYFWNHLPRKNKAKLCVEVSIPFDNILVIDDKGDIQYDFPHLFVEYKYKNTPFDHAWPMLKIDGELGVNLDEEKLMKVNIFPDKFPKIKRGKIHKKPIELSSGAMLALKRDNYKNIFDAKKIFNHLNLKDVFMIKSNEENVNSEYGEILIFEVTHKYTTTLKKYKDKNPNYYSLQEIANLLAGEEVKKEEKLVVFEIKRIYDWEISSKFEK